MKVWDLATRKELAVLEYASVTSLVFSPDGRMLVGAGAGKRIGLWNVGTWDLKTELEASTSRVQCLALSPDGKMLASVSHNESDVILWDVATGQKLQTTLKGRQDQLVYSVAFSSDSKTLAAGCKSSDRFGATVMWDVDSGKSRSTLPNNTNFVSVVTFSPDDKILAIGDSQTWR